MTVPPCLAPSHPAPMSTLVNTSPVAVVSQASSRHPKDTEISFCPTNPANAVPSGPQTITNQPKGQKWLPTPRLIYCPTDSSNLAKQNSTQTRALVIVNAVRHHLMRFVLWTAIWVGRQAVNDKDNHDHGRMTHEAATLPTKTLTKKKNRGLSQHYDPSSASFPCNLNG